MVSKKAIDLIIQHEVGGRAYYEKKLQAPIWAGGESGCTIGMGYDLGYNTDKQFMLDWSGAINLNFINALRPTIGIKGPQAKAMLKG
jgi:hypothetical protein